MRLYRNDKEWLKNNSPNLIKRLPTVKVDWEKRDKELLSKVRNAVENLLRMDRKPLRVTIGRVGYTIGEKALLEKKLSKLPKTQAYLNKNIESIEKFQERRILYTISQYKEQGKELVAWKIFRSAGIKDYKKWSRFIQNLLDD